MLPTKRLVLIVATVAFLGVCMVVVLVPPLEDLSPYNNGWNGLSKAVDALNARLARLVDLKAYGPNGLVVLVIGIEKPVTFQQCKILKKLIMYGATILIMDETGNSNQLLDCLGIGVKVGRGVIVDHLHYVVDPKLPIAKLKLANERTVELYLNIASPIETMKGKGSCIGYTYKTSFVDLDNDGELDSKEPSGELCICYRESLGNGTVYLFSDSSILINAMIDEVDNLDTLKNIVGNRTVVLVTDFWDLSLHTRFVMTLKSLGQLIVNTSLRYAIAVLLTITVYIVATSTQKTRK